MKMIERQDLLARLHQGDIRVLLMVLVHMTGDLRWLDEPFRPVRDVRLIPDPSAGLPLAAREQVVNAVADALLRNEPPAITDPGNETMRRMMSVCLGEDVSPEYAPLTREEMGLVSRTMAWSKPMPTDDLAEHRVLIVGAGISGIALAVSLKRLGIPFILVDKAGDVGGTWQTNRYPGCGVDTPNHSYAYSFGARYRWSRYFSPRHEIHAYLSNIVDSHDLRDNIHLNTEFTGSTWDSDRQQWVSRLVSSEGAKEVRTQFLVTAIGQLSDPTVPKIEGADEFKGPIFHSSAWQEDLSVEGKDIAVIGTGATAMQLVPTIADRVKSVSVFQRSPQWSRPIPGYQDSINEGSQWLLEHVPFYAEWFRFNMFWRYGDGLLPLLKKDPQWPHPERSVNRANERHRVELTEFIKSELSDRPDLIEKCIPTYPPYGKRILLDNGWYRTIKKPNVTLVDTAIERIVADGVRTVDGEVRKADIVVYSTGFKVTEMAARLGITGRDGLTLAEAWGDESPSAYLGINVPGFPNLFTMLGPGSGPGHGGSVVFQAECQSRFITSCIVQMIEGHISALEISRPAHDDYNDRVDAEHENLIWTHPGMSTYYRNRHGRVFSVMPWRFVDYWSMTHDADLSLFHLTREDMSIETWPQPRRTG